MEKIEGSRLVISVLNILIEGLIEIITVLVSHFDVLLLFDSKIFIYRS